MSAERLDEIRKYRDVLTPRVAAMVDDLLAALASAREENKARGEVLRQIADPSYIGNYEDHEKLSIYRKWASAALALTDRQGE